MSGEDPNALDREWLNMGSTKAGWAADSAPWPEAVITALIVQEGSPSGH